MRQGAALAREMGKHFFNRLAQFCIDKLLIIPVNKHLNRIISVQRGKSSTGGDVLRVRFV
ncbi:MAG: hypothetical protein EA381_15020 [Planctomycetaceae bacterium]|nr:MAG: hypothetical protein EA381_15020 [Planctomycetaceae bacterium]